jgi:hypothetical protein
LVAVQLGEGAVEESYRCLTDEFQEGDGESSMSYTLNLPSWFVDANKAELDLGTSSICITSGAAIRSEFGNPDFVQIPADADIFFVDAEVWHDRRLAQVGTKSLLVVRVTAPSSTQSTTAADVKNAVFGVGGQAVNTVSQFSSCSSGKLGFTKAIDTGNGLIMDGVIDLALTSSVVGRNIFDLENTMTSMVQDKLGGINLKATFSNVIWCVPEGTTFGQGGSSWIAYAYVPGQFSYYSNSKYSCMPHSPPAFS